MLKFLIAKYPAECPQCHIRFRVGRSRVIRHFDSNVMVHVGCLDAWVQRWASLIAET